MAPAAAGGIFSEENDTEFLHVPNISWSHYSELLRKSQLTLQVGGKEVQLALNGKHRGDIWGGYICEGTATLGLWSTMVLFYLEPAANCKDNFWNVHFLRIQCNVGQACFHIMHVIFRTIRIKLFVSSIKHLAVKKRFVLNFRNFQNNVSNWLWISYFANNQSHLCYYLSLFHQRKSI